MAWTRLDDQFFANPKVIDLSKDAKLLYLSAVTYSAGQLTDGRISPGALRMVAALVDAPSDCAAELVACGLWEIDGADYVIHDYLEYNPTAAEVRAKREADRQRKRPATNEGSGSNSTRIPDGIAADSKPPVPTPVPVSPNPVESSVSHETADAAAPQPVPIARKGEKPTKQNPVWNAVAALCGGPATRSERSDFGLTVTELTAIDATPDEIAAFGPWWFQNHEDAQLTHRCLRNHFGRFRNAPQRPPQISDIKNPMVRAALTTDLSDIRAELEAKRAADRDTRAAFLEQNRRPRQLPESATGFPAGKRSPQPDVLPPPRASGQG